MGLNDSMTDEVAEDDSEEVIENVTLCSECNEYSGHDILKERNVGSGRDLLIKCLSCGAISSLQIREPKSIVVPFILTDGPNSTRAELEIDDDEEVSEESEASSEEDQSNESGSDSGKRPAALASSGWRAAALLMR